MKRQTLFTTTITLKPGEFKRLDEENKEADDLYDARHEISDIVEKYRLYEILDSYSIDFTKDYRHDTKDQ